MLDLAFVVLFQAAAGAASPPAETAPAQSTAMEQEADPRQARVCRAVRITGSRARRGTVCTTPQEDAERRRWSQRALTRVQNSANQPGGEAITNPQGN